MNFFLKNLISELKIIKKPLFVSLFLYLPITLLSISQPVIIGHAIHEVSLNQIEKSYNYVIFFFIALFFSPASISLKRERGIFGYRCFRIY